jgi:uncharacterized membrane protein
MEFEMENRNENGKNEKKIRSSNSSINSNPEIKDKKILRISLILINIISLFSGFYFFKYRQYYLSPEYNFEYYDSLLVYVITYSLGMIASLIFSVLFTSLIKICIYIINMFNENKATLANNEQLSENSFRYINGNSNDVSFIPYTLTIFVVATMIIYFISLPYSIFLLIFMAKNETYSKFKDFRLLYFFIIINTLAGSILFYVLLIIVFVKREGSFRKINYYIDDNNLENLRNEIRGEMNKAEQ